MSALRPAVVALSNSEQQRETLVIMLAPAFAVVAAAAPAAVAADVRPAAVVLAPATWDDDLLALVERRWPAAGVVAVDPPAALAAAGRCALASWSDPFSVPEAVLLTALAARPAAGVDADLQQALRRASQALRPPFARIRTLAELARCAARPASVAIATRLLADHLHALVERLAWVEEAGDEDRAAATPTATAARRTRTALAATLRGEPEPPGGQR